MAVRGMNSSTDYRFKVVLLGEGCVGKTCILMRYVNNSFDIERESTIQAGFLQKVMTIDGHTVHIDIWDTAGQEKYHSLSPLYYRGAQGALLVYNVSDPRSFEKVKSWVRELHLTMGHDICLTILGNKIDLMPPKEKDTPSPGSIIREALIFSSGIKGCKHYVTSAKAGTNIHEALNYLVVKMIERTELTRGLSSPTHQLNGSNGSYPHPNYRTIRVDESEEPTPSMATKKCNC